MNRKKIDVDVIRDILELASAARPDSTFIQSLSRQYEERGNLSKKQLQGLHSKAGKIPGIPAHKLATLEAVILRRPTKYKSELPEATPLYEKDSRAGELIANILQKFPQHKRVLFLKAKYDNNETLSSTELAELEKFNRLRT